MTMHPLFQSICEAHGAPKKYNLKYDHTDIGFCRVYYKIRHHLYCVQEEGQGVYEFYRCTDDGEPDTTVKFDGCCFEPIPEPTEYEQGFMNFLKDKGALLS